MQDTSTFTFPAMLAEHSSVMEKTDDNGHLQIYSYKSGIDIPDSCKTFRGLVFRGETPLFRSIGRTPEYSLQDTDTMKWANDVDSLTFFPSYEGTLIRIFYDVTTEKWYTSTHRKLDAFHSRWGSKISFGEIFEKALSHQNQSIASLTPTLDKSHVYLFFIRSIAETRLVSIPSSTETVFHVGTLLNGNTFTTEINIHVTKPTPLMRESSALTVDDVRNFVANSRAEEMQGVIAFYPDGRNFKIVNQQYSYLSQIRGNEASVMFRYLQIRGNATHNQLFYQMYPEHVGKFVQYENSIFKIAKIVHNSYVNRFILKQHTIVSHEEHRIIRECHGWHISNRQTNKVTLQYVTSVLAKTEMASTVNALIKRLTRTGTLALVKKDVDVTDVKDVKDVKDVGVSTTDDIEMS
jgi:hypothetical protein